MEIALRSDDVNGADSSPPSFLEAGWCIDVRGFEETERVVYFQKPRDKQICD